MPSGHAIPLHELLADLHRVLAMAPTQAAFTTTYYDAHGAYDLNLVSRRFGSWSKARLALGLPPQRQTTSRMSFMRSVKQFWELACLRCGELFKSPDKVRVRVCPRCRKANGVAD